MQSGQVAEEFPLPRVGGQQPVAVGHVVVEAVDGGGVALPASRSARTASSVSGKAVCASGAYGSQPAGAPPPRALGAGW